MVTNWMPSVEALDEIAFKCNRTLADVYHPLVGCLAFRKKDQDLPQPASQLTTAWHFREDFLPLKGRIRPAKRDK